jgi:urease accessory protein
LYLENNRFESEMAIQILPSRNNSKTTLQPGQAVIAVKPAAAGSRISKLSSAYPVKLISPLSSHDRRAVLVFILSYGGGMVPGDQVNISVNVDPGCRLGLLTQGSTKLYKNPNPSVISRQILDATVERGAALLMIPDPLQPFKDSVYEQRQVFHVHHGSSLLLLDWISEGRRAMGEVWDLTSLKSMNEVWTCDEFTPPPSAGQPTRKSSRRLLIRDNVILSESKPELLETLRRHVNGLGIFGTLIIGGPLFERLCNFFLSEFAAQPRIGEINWSQAGSGKLAAHSDVIWSAASTRGYTIVKFGAPNVDGARRWLRGMLEKEGTVEREFGTRHLMCLQDR